MKKFADDIPKTLQQASVEDLRAMLPSIDPWWLSENMPPSSLFSDEEWFSILKQTLLNYLKHEHKLPKKD